MSAARSSTTLALAAAPREAALSREQKTFNRLIRQIGAQRERLQAWQDTLPLFWSRHEVELQPLQDRFDAAREKFARLLDRSFDEGKLTKTERKKVSEIIATLMAELLQGQDNDPARVALYDKHNGTSFAEEREWATESIKAVVEEVFGKRFADEAGIGSPEELAALMEGKFSEESEAGEAAHEQQHAGRKRSAKALARDARLAREALSASQSLREVFRKLASVLHPDREPDAQERTRKTALMQRVNAAYEKKDLLALLELRLEAEQIDATSISALPPARLRNYNKVLTEQLAELEDEVELIASRFHPPNDPFSRVQAHPGQILSWLERDITQLKRATNSIEHDLLALLDPHALKAWLKGYRLSRS